MTGAELKQYRKVAGLSQEGLARLAGVSVKTISRLEHERHVPFGSTLKKLRDALAQSLAG
jgi:transcriptional regulator with XRE-family HTH domain